MASLTIEQNIRALVMGQQRILSLAVQIDPSVQIYPQWTIMQVIAHLSGWDELAINLFGYANGELGISIPSIDSLDDYNNGSVSVRGGRSLGECVDEYIVLRKQLVGLAQGAEEVTLTKELELPWGGKGTLMDVLQIWIEHEEQHRLDIYMKVTG